VLGITIGEFMKKTVKIKKDKKTKECYLDLKDFEDIVDVSKVVYYELTAGEGKSFSLTFFDKDKKLLPVSSS
jgi:hypothetical protein